MKVDFATLVVVGATLTNAIAVAEPEARVRGGIKGWCGVAGTACAKRDIGVCGIPGAPCARMKRSAEAVAEAFAIAEPRVRGGIKGWCGVAGTACAKSKRDLIDVGSSVEDAIMNIYAREADAAADPRVRGGIKGWCGVAGTACARKTRFRRDAVADPEADPRVRGGIKGWCGVAGTACAKTKRAAEAYADAAADPRVRGGIKGWCGVAGTACAKVKRDAEADAVADPKKGGIKGWCGVAGTACAKRDVEENEIVARTVQELDAEFGIEERDAQDGPGTALRAAYDAFMHVKRDAEAISEEATPFELLNFCSEYDCDEDTVNAIAARAAGTLDEREAEACFAADGACTHAKRALDEIEAKLTAAVEAL